MSLPLPLPTAVAVYITIWWITLFAILPLGIRSAHDTGEEIITGNEPGAPLAPRLLFKAGLTTVAAAVLFILLMCVMMLTGVSS